MYVCLCECIMPCIMLCMYRYHRRSGGGCWTSRTGVIGSCNVLDVDGGSGAWLPGRAEELSPKAEVPAPKFSTFCLYFSIHEAGGLLRATTLGGGGDCY